MHARRAAAVAAAVASWALAEGVFGVDVHAPVFGGEPSPARDLGIVAVAVSALVAGLAGWALVAVLEPLAGRAARLWSGLAFVVLQLSLGGPFGAGIVTSSRIVLVCLHLVLAAVLIPILRATVASSHRR